MLFSDGDVSLFDEARPLFVDERRLNELDRVVELLPGPSDVRG